jgi:hypothetical protein
MATNKRDYDITEYASKALAALHQLEQTQQPGQMVSGGKTDVVRHIKDDIKALLDKGYTTQQISDALKVDVFSILPKSITEIITGKKPAKQRKVAATQKATAQNEQQATKAQADTKHAHAANRSATIQDTNRAPKPPANQATGGEQKSNATFEIKPDTPNGEL